MEMPRSLAPLIASLALTACWGATPPPDVAGPPIASAGIPGQLWATAAKPWRLPRASVSLAIAGDSVLVGSYHGWLSRVDLATGRVVAERHVADLSILAVAALPGSGRWIAIGQSEKAFQAYVVEGAALVATPISLAIEKSETTYGIPGVAVLADGGVVIATRNLPLAIYDPKTWDIRTLLDPAIGWSSPSVNGTVVIATRRYKTHRFEIATGARSEVVAQRAEVAATHVVASIDRNRSYYLSVRDAVDKPATTLPDPIESFTVDRTGTRVVTTYKGQLKILALPAGEVLHTVDLGPSALGFTAKPVVDDRRAVLEIGAVLRVVDLATGKVTEAGDAPWGRNTIAVDRTGAIQERGRSTAWQIIDGKLAGSTSFDKLTSIGTREDDTHFVLHDNKHAEMRTIGASGAPATLGTWELEQNPIDAWVGSDNAVVFDVTGEDDKPSRALRAKGTTVTELIAYHPDASLLDVDVDAGDSVVALKGRVGLAHGGTPTLEVRMPGCAEYGSAVLELGGKRVATYSERELAIWDRTTGALLGAAGFPTDILEVRFIAGTSAVVVAVANQLLVWAPNQDARAITISDLLRVAVSRDGRRLAIGYGDGHLALFDLVRLRTGMPLGPAPARTAIPTSCEGEDPFSQPPDDEFDHEGDGCPDC